MIVIVFFIELSWFHDLNYMCGGIIRVDATLITRVTDLSY